MTALVDTSVLIDYLRGHRQAAQVLERQREDAPLHASEMTRLEVLAGMRPADRGTTDSLLATLIWHPVDQVIAERRPPLPNVRGPDRTLLRPASVRFVCFVPRVQVNAPDSVRMASGAHLPDSRAIGDCLTPDPGAEFPLGRWAAEAVMWRWREATA